MTQAAQPIERHDVVLGDFVLREQIGEGGFGTVYLAEQRTLGRSAVVKIMRGGLAHRRDAIERFVREARLASQLDHPCAAHIYAFGSEDDGTLWIAMELVRGTSLQDLVADEPLAIDRMLPMFERLCDAVQTAHAQGIVHRDIKPSNVMVTSRGGRLMPKLLDFGIAKQLMADLDVADGDAVRAISARAATVPPSETGTLELDATASAASSAVPSAVPSVATDNTANATAATGLPQETASLTMAGQLLGSPPYMAPEQWVDASRVGPATDQYGLALLAFEALTSERACNGITIADLAEQHLQKPLRSHPLIPAEVHAVLARGAAKRPEDRFPDLDTFVTALRTATGHELRDDEPAPTLRGDLRVAWTSDAPQPIAEAIASLAAARTPERICDRVVVAARTIAQWLGTLAIACRSRCPDGSYAVGETIRDLRRHVPRDDAWLDIAIALARESFEQPERWAMPELVTWCEDREAVAGLRALLRATNSDARAQLAELDIVLDGLAWLLDYTVGLEIADGIELWIGTRTEDRAIFHTPTTDADDRVVVLDADGARVLLLAPLVTIASPIAGEDEEMFVFAGPARNGGALYVAAPRGYERDDLASWSQLATHLIDPERSDRDEDDDDRPPYPGLAAFTTSDHASFVGRERETRELVNRLRVHPLVVVVGPSGAGKSSFLAAGLVPALPRDWHAAIVRPGSDPVAALAAVCDGAGNGPYRDAAPPASTLVVIVDQAEELFTQTSGDARLAFARALDALATSSHIRVVLALRDDFLCRLDELGPWRGTLARCVQILGVPGRADLERIVREPAQRRGHEFEDPELPSRMVDEVVDRPGALPLLAFAAAELWDRRDRHFRRITTAAYDEIGGVGGALVQHADGVVDQMTVGDRRLVRLAFRRLLTAEGARIAYARAELVTALGGGPTSARVVDRLVAARLLVVRDDEAGERVEIIHEALARTWPRLEAWRREDASSAKLREQLAAAARHWDDRGRPDGLVWRGDALDELRRWRVIDDIDSGETAIEAAFVRASEAAARRSRRRKLAVVAGAFAALASTSVVLAVARDRISDQRAAAEQRVADGFEERGRLAVLAGEHARALLYLAEAARLGVRGPTHDLLVARAATSVEALDKVEVSGAGPLEFAGWNERVAVTLHDRIARLWDRATSRERARIADAIAIAPIGDAIATLDMHGDLRLTGPNGEVRWRVVGAQRVAPRIGIATQGNLVASWGGPAVRLFTLSGEPRGELAHDGNVDYVAFSEDASRIATTERGAIRLWDASGRAIATCATTAKRLPGLRFLPGNQRVATGGDDGIVRICDAGRGPNALELAGHLGIATGTVVDRDGRILVSSSMDGTARVWDLAKGLTIGVLAGHRGAIRTLELSPDGKLLATGGEDATIRIWDLQSARAIASLDGHGGRIVALHWDAADRLASASVDGTLRTWNVRHVLTNAIAHRHTGRVDRIAVSEDGARVVTNDEGSASVWDAATWHPRDEIATTSAALLGRLHVVSAHDKGARIDGAPLATDDHVVRVATHDTLVATASDAGMIRLWDSGGHARGAVTVDFTPYYFDFDPTGRWLLAAPAVGSLAGVAVIDTMTSREVARLVRGSEILEPVFDATRLAVVVGREVRVFATGAWTESARLVGSRSDIITIALVPDGRIVTACEDATVAVWDRAGRMLATLSGNGRANGLDVSRDGTLLAAGTVDGAIDIWDLATDRLLVTNHGHRQDTLAVKFAPDGTRVFSAGRDGRTASWDLARPTRSAEDLAHLVHCRVPLQLVGEAVLDREIDFADPSCR